MAAVLVGLNAASYTQKEKTPDSEISPNRSTFNAGSTGTQAFFTLLSETGRKPVRWQEPPAALLTAGDKAPKVFVVTGNIKRDFTPAESEELLRWVSSGGRLVVIDREPPDGLVSTTANWRISFKVNDDPEIFSVDVTDPKQMIGGRAAVKPVQPSIYTQSINAVQPSRFASGIQFERFVDSITAPAKVDPGSGPPPPPKAVDPSNQKPPVRTAERPISSDSDSDGLYNLPSPTPVQMLPMGSTVESPSQIAPVVHFGSDDQHLVVDVPFGEGKIVFLSDPYVVSNAGISLVDNAQLGINLVATNDGVVAFDEFHQGFGKDSNRFLQFFAGTPVIAIFLQVALLIGLLFVSQSRRFARPVPEPEEDRLSKLEYVAAMADLQSRTKSFDLAIENIYSEFRRRVTRHLGLDNFTAKYDEIASLIAERTSTDLSATAATLNECEEIIRGETTNKREVVRLVDELRKIENALGLQRSGRAKT